MFQYKHYLNLTHGNNQKYFKRSTDTIKHIFKRFDDIIEENLGWHTYKFLSHQSRHYTSRPSGLSAILDLDILDVRRGQAIYNYSSIYRMLAALAACNLDNSTRDVAKTLLIFYWENNTDQQNLIIYYSNLMKHYVLFWVFQNLSNNVFTKAMLEASGKTPSLLGINKKYFCW